MGDRRREFVAEIERDGGPLTPALAAAFAAVPREVFVAGGFQMRDGTWKAPGSAGFLDVVYSNDVLVTKLAGGLPVSSSSQPSLMAIMLAALGVRAGERVLEIGAGTGYNAALLRALGAEVTSVDVQEDVAARARVALEAAGVDGVRVTAGDGYAGAPGEVFDRVIVTVGLSGLSPHWFEQAGAGSLGQAGAERGGSLGRAGAGRGGSLGRAGAGRGGRARAGLVVAPVEHAGTHPVLAARAEGDGVVASVVCPAGFMSAAGPLLARHPRSHPEPVGLGRLGVLGEVAGPRWATPLDATRYRDLWYAAGVWSQRATHAAVAGQTPNLVVLLDEAGTGGAALLPDGSVLAGGGQAGRWAAAAGEVLDRWEAAGRPSIRAWRIRMALTADPVAPIWYPARWELRSAS